MHRVVDDPEPDPRTNGVGVAVPAVHEHGDVVVHVEEVELGLAQDDEERVEQFGELREGEEERPHTGPHRPDVGARVAHGVPPAPDVHHVERGRVDAQDGVEAEHAQGRAPHAEGRAQVVGRAVPHVPAPAEDQGQVEEGDVDGPVPVGVHPRDGRTLVELVLHLVDKLQGV